MTPTGPPGTPPRPRPGPKRPVDQRRGAVARSGARPGPRPAQRPVARPSARPAPRTAQRPPRERVRRVPSPGATPPRRVVATRAHVARPSRRLVGALAVLLLCFGAVIVRLVQVQALSNERYTAFGVSQRFQDIALPADRGSIFDRNGYDLAVTIPQRTVWANPSLVKDPNGTALRLGQLLHLEPAEVAKVTDRLTSGAKFVYVKRRVADELADAVGKADLPGVFMLEEPKRFTPAGDLGRSMLGSVGVDNEGLSGLELQYDDLLTGAPGELLVERDPNGRTIPGGQQQLEPAQRGDDLVLTVDRAMQYETERALSAQIAAKGANGGTAIVTRPDTGEILALANLVTDPKTGQVVANGDNTAVTASYEPGSVNKVITVAATLEEGLVGPSTELVVPDRLQVGDHEFSDHDPHPTGSYSVTRILTESSNIGTIKLAQLLGKDRLDQYLRRFGFGAKTSLGFPGEAAGILLPRNEYNGTSLGSIPIGQGIAVTAMQMLAAYNAIANDGIYVAPKLVMETVGADGTRRPVAAPEGHRVISQDTAQKMREMLASVVSEGTGTRGGITGYTVGGKTGTARKPINGGYEDSHGRYHYVATFAGFVPVERPELSIIVVIDEPTGDIYGGSVAAPVFADLAQYGLRLFRIPPPLVERAPAPDTAAALAGPQTTVADHPAGKRVRATAATATTVPTTVAPSTPTTVASSTVPVGR